MFRIRKFCLDPDTDPELLFRFRIQHKKKEKINNLILIFSVAKPEPPGAATFKGGSAAGAGAHFFVGRNQGLGIRSFTDLLKITHFIERL